MMQTLPTRTLYRPVGLKELRLVLDANLKRFPPRLDWQPIFYPVLDKEYAIRIARDWNTKDTASGYAGFVTEFDVDAVFLTQFEEHTVGARAHRELWIPAEELQTFNLHIRGSIRVIAVFYGDSYIDDAGFRERLKEILNISPDSFLYR